MALEGWYYMHKNGDLIYKRDTAGMAADIRESDFAKMLWPFDPTDRAGAWRILVESMACGVNKDRVIELAGKWGCDDSDARKYAQYVGVTLQIDGDMWCATSKDFVDLQQSPAGFGVTPLEAMSVLCNELNFKPTKTWGATFAEIVSAQHCI
ncbi:MAG: hypothetical protein QX198_01415 [Methylococcaceae bacterium]